MSDSMTEPGRIVPEGPGSSAPGRAPPGPPRYILIGGFLGAGKTTAVAQLAQRLTERGGRVGLITNDQGSRLVDTAMLRSRGFATEEIPGGCFCCRFSSLVEAAARLSVERVPDVFIAEPVGSCTDLVATVAYPLRRLYGDRFTVAPLSALVDPVRALRVLGVEAGPRFSEKVVYIYRKQLEEADLIVINKCDLLDACRLAGLRQALRAGFPRAELFEVSARTGAGLAEWFDRITVARQGPGRAMAVDYSRYAEGEARLGWLNCAIALSAPAAFDGNRLLAHLACDLQARLAAAGAEVAHLKMTLSPAAGLGDLAVVNVVRNDLVAELSQNLAGPLERGQLILNLRAEAEPALLAEAVTAVLEHAAHVHAPLTVAVEHLEQFRPGKPTPTHRLASFA